MLDDWNTPTAAKLHKAVEADDLPLFLSLSVRTARCLLQMKLTSRARVERAWADLGERGFLAVPNFGRKSLKELKLAFDLPDIPAPVTRPAYLKALRIVEVYGAQMELAEERAARLADGWGRDGDYWITRAMSAERERDQFVRENDALQDALGEAQARADHLVKEAGEAIDGLMDCLADGGEDWFEAKVARARAFLAKLEASEQTEAKP